MRSSYGIFDGVRRRALSAALLVFALVSPALTILAQDSEKPATRPRRATQPIRPDTWPTPTPDAVTLPQVEPPTLNLKSEPLVRIGLAANARSVTVSTDGRLLDASDANAAPVPFEVARLRVEPRSYTPPPPAPATDTQAERVETASSSSSTLPARASSNAD